MQASKAQLMTASFFFPPLTEASAMWLGPLPPRMSLMGRDTLQVKAAYPSSLQSYSSSYPSLSNHPLNVFLGSSSCKSSLLPPAPVLSSKLKGFLDMSGNISSSTASSANPQLIPSLVSSVASFSFSFCIAFCNSSLIRAFSMAFSLSSVTLSALSSSISSLGPWRMSSRVEPPNLSVCPTRRR